MAYSGTQTHFYDDDADNDMVKKYKENFLISFFCLRDDVFLNV